MTVISTVGSGKDFADLQAWWDSVKSSSDAAQHAECFAGNLGFLDMDDFDTATPTASDHPIIFASDGEKHDGGNTAANGAYIDVDGAPRVGIHVKVSFLEIDGIHFDVVVESTFTNSGVFSEFVSGNFRQGRFLTVKNCNFRTSGDTDGTPAGVNYQDTDTAYPSDPVCTVFNNNFWGNGEDGGTAIQIHLISDAAMTVSDTMFSEIYFNTSHDFGNNGIVIVSTKNFIGTPTHDCIQTNNAMIDHDNFDYLTFLSGGGLASITRTFSVSTDATADDEGGSGNLINKAAVDCFETVGSDNTPKDSGELHNAGTSVSGITDDILGVSRPQGSDEDIGAFELEVVSTGFSHQQTVVIM